MSSHKKSGPAVCPNGHAMDDGLFHCPACGAFRPSANAPAPTRRELLEDIKRAAWDAKTREMRRHGI